ncbi:MAG TPA: hypothetical protein V6D25_30520 [Leptolyngbyaceae cyanobacterium]
MFNAKGNLQLQIIKSIFATFNTGLIFVGLVGCNAEQKLPSTPPEVQPPVSQPEAPNQQNDDDDDDKEQEKDNQDDDKD